MKIINKKIEELKMYDNNPRKNDEAVPYVMESIQKYGFKVPLVIDKNNVIVTGHTRYKAALKLGIKEVPCIVADDLTDEQIREFRIVDNKTSEYAEWDIDKLLVELEELDFMSEDELKQTIKDLIDDSDIVREKKNNKNDLHPTMKPIKLLAKFIKNSSNKDDLVLDIFGGSGSTLIACEQLDRRCHMIEFDEKHASTIIKRWEDFTGKKAIKVS